MALVMATWDLPTGKEQLDRYAAWAEQSIKETLRLPGLQEWRGFRNPSGMTPQVMAIHEFDTMASLQRWLQSADYAATVATMRTLGCTSFSLQIWDVSPLASTPLRPPER